MNFFRKYYCLFNANFSLLCFLFSEMNNSSGYVKPLRKRFGLTSSVGPIKMYSEMGELMRPEQDLFVFEGGTLKFSDDCEAITVSACKQSKAVVLFEIRDKIIAAFCLSDDRGLLVKHLNAPSGNIPRDYMNNAVAVLVLPDREPFRGFIQVKSVKEGYYETAGPVCVRDLQQPRIHVPAQLLLMYQHLRNQEKSGERPINKHTFEDHENTGRFKDIGTASRMFSANEAMQWLEKSKNHTAVEAALQKEFVFGTKTDAVITYPKQLMSYVSTFC